MACYDPSTSILAGMDPALLRLQLANLQQAYIDLSTGAKVEVASLRPGRRHEGGDLHTGEPRPTDFGHSTAAGAARPHLDAAPCPERAVLTTPKVLGPDSKPIDPKAIAKIRERARAPRRGMGASLNTNGYAQFFPYDAADFSSNELGQWFPQVRSPDSEINIYRDRIAARARDLYRNDVWAKGAIGRILDSTIGAEYRLAAKPDYRALALYDKGFDATWAKEFRRVVEGRWRSFADDLGRYNDVSRQLTDQPAVPPRTGAQTRRRREPDRHLLAA